MPKHKPSYSRRKCPCCGVESAIEVKGYILVYWAWLVKWKCSRCNRKWVQQVIPARQESLWRRYDINWEKDNVIGGATSAVV